MPPKLSSLGSEPTGGLGNAAEFTGILLQRRTLITGAAAHTPVYHTDTRSTQQGCTAVRTQGPVSPPGEDTEPPSRKPLKGTVHADSNLTAVIYLI